MLVLKLTVFVFLPALGVLGRNTQRGNSRHRLEHQEYTSSVNHPPEPEIYEGIPVSVVYEDESIRADKSIKSGISTVNNFTGMNKEFIEIESSINREQVPNTSSSEKTNVSPTKEVSADSNRDGPTPNKSKSSSTTNTPNQNEEIPVAVVYDPESAYYTHPNNKRVSTKRRKIQRPSVEEEQAAAKDTSDPSVSRDNSENRQLQSSYKIDSSAEEKLLEKEGLKTSVVSNANKQQVPITEKQQQFTSRSKNTQRHSSTKSTKERQEGSSISEIQNFPKRDNLTRERESVPIIQSENVVFSHSGNFRYSYEGGDGTKAFEKGELKTYEDDKTGEAVSGGFSYTAKDGNEYSLTYTADENGYRPVGAHLPTPPPIPPAIARALAYLATKTTPEPVTESFTKSDS